MGAKTWSTVTKPGDYVVYVVPNNDLIEHTLDDDCICGPDTDYLDGEGKMVVHHSLDGREQAEPSG